MPRLTARLLAAYRVTEYRIGDASIRIGRRSAAADAALHHLGVRRAALVTAYNPLSRPTPVGRNLRCQRSLVQLARRLPRLPAVAAAGTRWEEPMLLLGTDPRRAACLGRCFRQHAIVVLRMRERPRLILLTRMPGHRPRK